VDTLPYNRTSSPVKDDRNEDAALSQDEIDAILEHIVNTTGADAEHVYGLLAETVQHREDGDHAAARTVLRKLAAMTYSPGSTNASHTPRLPPRDGTPARDLEGKTVDLDAQVDAALDRADIADPARRMAAKLHAHAIGRVPSDLPGVPRDVDANSPIMDRLEAAMDRRHMDPVQRISAKIEAMATGQMPERLPETSRVYQDCGDLWRLMGLSYRP